MKILLGNKSDLAFRAVTDEQIEEFASGYEFTYFDISAKTGSRVREAFQFAVDKAFENIKKVDEKMIEKAGAKKLAKPLEDMPPKKTKVF